VKKSTGFKRWVIQAPVGLILIGAGLSMAIDAGNVKAAGGNWFLYGTSALVVFNSGICLVIDAAIRKIK
jgi:hypothetical protein